jgi:hypothetical protein
VTPGNGKKAAITERTYDEVWRAALKVADEHFEVREQDPARGVILALVYRMRSHVRPGASPTLTCPSNTGGDHGRP